MRDVLQLFLFVNFNFFFYSNNGYFHIRYCMSHTMKKTIGSTPAFAVEAEARTIQYIADISDSMISN